MVHDEGVVYESPEEAVDVRAEAHRDALLRERSHYVYRGERDRVKEVDAELRANGFTRASLHEGTHERAVMESKITINGNLTAKGTETR